MTVEGTHNTSMAGDGKVKIKYTGPKAEVIEPESAYKFKRGEAVEVDSLLATRLIANGQFKKVTK